eukprot:CAMPEP_0174854940 /NCGR_PEP_ID=MMETSP1114-20130205/32030_1 /TAXON_ID=312471 /ORGANISM="Neobodo designis, Strain CCAP 1951/1" /LENGTH=212 /DNA_ID=CAMNT_0016089649 /DNA_START=39 /DNA_END=677 /DNA_ORIENTATION=+
MSTETADAAAADPMRHLPLDFEQLPADGYDAVAADCVAVMSNAEAFAELVAALDEDVVTLVAHQQAVAKELSDLATVTLPTLSADVDRLYATACDLQTVFARIDRLREVMDSLHHVVMQLHAVVKRITEPTSVKERASGFLRTFGFGSKNTDDAAPAAPGTVVATSSARAAGIWSRIPAHIVVDGCAPIAYHERVVALLRRLAVSTAPTEGS